MKFCTKCQTDKPLERFCTDNRTPDKKKRWCRDCCKSSVDNWKKENPEKAIESQVKWRAYNKPKIKQRDAEKYLKNKEKVQAYSLKWRKENPEKQKARQVKWWANNIDKRNAYRKKYLSSFKNHLHATISRSILKSLRGGDKGGATWPSLVGYDVETLITHLNTTMPKGYTWADYGREKLHIDHKIPVAAFNFSSPQDIDFKKCWGLSNLRLLPAVENMSKNDRIDKPFQPSLALMDTLWYNETNYNVSEQRSVML
jgi:hypothetical protein